MSGPVKKALLILLAVTLPLTLLFGFICFFFFMASAGETSPFIRHLNSLLLFLIFLLMTGGFGVSFYLVPQYLFNTKKVFKALSKRKTIGINGKKFREVYKKPEQIRGRGIYLLLYLSYMLVYFFSFVDKLPSDDISTHPGYFTAGSILACMGMLCGFLGARSWLWKEPVKEKNFKQTPLTRLLLTKI